MKWLLSIAIITALSIDSQCQSIPARCPYQGPQVPANRISKTVGDITITTTDGITRNLYNTLDSGKTVFIDLFYTTCSWCQYYAPVIEEVYQNHGAGTGDIEFWGISNNLFDPDSVIDQYRLNYNITNPCAGPQGGGTTAHTTIISGQNFQGWPTYCVICPDRTMFFDPCYPPVVTGFDPFFETCAAMVDVKDLNNFPTHTGISVYPNPASDRISFNLSSFNINEEEIRVEIHNILGERVFSCKVENIEEQEVTIDIGSLKPGVYFLRLTGETGLAGTGKFYHSY